VQAFGALRVTCAAQKLVVHLARLLARHGGLEKDSVGQDSPACRRRLPSGSANGRRSSGAPDDPSTDSDFRFTSGFVETTGHTVTVRVSAVDETARSTASEDVQVREYSQRQGAFKDYFPDLSLENYRLDAEVVSGSGR